MGLTVQLGGVGGAFGGVGAGATTGGFAAGGPALIGATTPG